MKILILSLFALSGMVQGSEFRDEKCSFYEEMLRFDLDVNYLGLGDCYYLGIDGHKNVGKAVSLWQSSLLFGSDKAAVRLGVHYSFFTDSSNDLGAGLLRMASKNDSEASLMLGLYYLKYKDRYNKGALFARKYLNQAFEQGSKVSVFVIIYAQKHGLVKALPQEKSDYWVSKAKKLSDKGYNYDEVINDLKHYGYLD